MNKENYLNFYREKFKNEKIKNTGDVGNKIKKIRNESYKSIEENYSEDEENMLHHILLSTYSSYVVMIEERNRIKNYEYMDFSRRMGELWEPFCKICWEYSVNELEIIEPIKFSDAVISMRSQTSEVIDDLNIEDTGKAKILEQFNNLLSIISSGAVNMKSDLHFNFNDFSYNIDFKNSFNSNEKGNVNRLLAVGKIYNLINDDYKNYIFVRSNDNNHYLDTLKKSNIWEVYTGDECYEKIRQITGFNLKEWIVLNINWLDDLEKDVSEYLLSQNLDKYIQW